MLSSVKKLNSFIFYINMKNNCKKKIDAPILKRDCVYCEFSDNCALKKWNERQLELF